MSASVGKTVRLRPFPLEKYHVPEQRRLGPVGQISAGVRSGPWRGRGWQSGRGPDLLILWSCYYMVPMSTAFKRVARTTRQVGRGCVGRVTTRRKADFGLTLM